MATTTTRAFSILFVPPLPISQIDIPTNLQKQHFLSLFLFIPIWPSVRTQFARLLSSPPLSLPPSATFPVQLPPSLYHHLQYLLSRLPRQVLFLFLNAATHYICVRGVNMLASRSSALTVTIVLNIRKLVSLLLSIYLFGNKLSLMVMVGAMVVFGGGGMYAAESQRVNKQKWKKG